MTTPWEYLINGSIVRAAYETFNQPFSQAILGQNNAILAILFIVFHFLLLMKVQNATAVSIVSAIFLMFLWGLLPVWGQAILSITILLEFAVMIYSFMSK